jgi:hypothetical protein
MNALPFAAFSLLVALPTLFLGEARAQDEEEEEVSDLDTEGSKSSKKPKKGKKQQEVREIVKGTYAKSNVGGGLYLGGFRGIVSPGTTVALSVGRDFVNQERVSAAGEVGLWQGINNGCNYELQADGLCPGRPGVNAYIQGDLRTYTIAANGELSFYPSRRFGVGLRAGGGVLFSPLIMEPGYFESEVVSQWDANPGYHEKPHPVAFGGPTFEYYTKLSHFSVGADVDIFYAIGFDLGMNASGYLKYTF